jgi:YidC/Oxa1 family membrane protein insertase
VENLRILLFAALGMVLFLLWQAWQQDYGTTPPSPTATPAEAPVPALPTAPAQPDIPSGPLPAEPTPTPLERPGAIGGLQTGTRVVVRTDVLEAEIDTTGGDLRSVKLLRYPVALDAPNTPYRLMGDGEGLLFVVQSGLLSNPVNVSHHVMLEAEQREYVMAEGQDELRVPLRWKGEDGLAVTKLYTFRRDSYQVSVSYQVANGSAAPWSGRLYAQVLRGKPEEQSHLFAYTYTGGVLHSADNRYQKVDFDRMLSEPVTRDAVGGWGAMIQHYFGVALIPEQADPIHYYARALDPQRYLLGVVLPALTVAPGQEGSLAIDLYAGPKEQARLAAAAPDLQLLVDYGYLTLIADPLFWLLQQIHRVVGNWGWAIVLLTVLIKLAFFHLSAASYKSMANMRRLQPRLMALKERYGDDRARLNQAMMELYKTEKINPLGGCLPIVVQIPVFIALYWVLLESVELRQAPFVLWIHDLSVHDPYFVLPVLMGATMFIQQRLNPAPMDPIQQKVMMVLPLVFTVFFVFFPAGLVLYWLVNNALSILQQWLITRRIAPSPAT